MIRRLLLVTTLVGASAFALPPAAAGGGCHGPVEGEMTSGVKEEVAIGGCAFLDTVTYVEPGESVTWTNKDPAPHSVTGAVNSWGDENYLEQGEKVSYRFDKPGVFPYYCVLHPAMVGAVVVGDAKAMLGTSVEGVNKIDLTAATTSDEAPPADSGGSALVPIAGIALAVAAGAALLFVLRRRAGAATPA
ncbi:MAG TPA: plastocyanin/azurin family copper-binding protein [Actinomycetota bacterium]|nr:plastocyanin/azurin family copper-binding protein [Actinomycetota bacterium]